MQVMKNRIKNILIAKAGEATDREEILADGCRFLIRVRTGNVIVRLLYGESVHWSLHGKAVLPGETVPVEDQPRLIFLPNRVNDQFHCEIPFVVTYSLALRLRLRLETIIGDLTEEYFQLRVRRPRINAKVWLCKQVCGSLFPTLFQILRFDFIRGFRDWLVWYVPLPNKMYLGADSANITFKANVRS